MKLNLGCGDKRLEGYTNIDKYVENAFSLKMDALSLEHSNDSAEEIIALQLIEHLTFAEFDMAMKEWFRVLKPNGALIIECPDLEIACRAFINAGFDEKWGHRIFPLYGRQNSPGQFHKSGYTFQLLRVRLMQAGFKDIVKGNPTSPAPEECIRVECKKGEIKNEDNSKDS